MRSLAIACLILPLALSLAACDTKSGDGEGVTGEPIAKIAAPAGKTWADTVAVSAEGGFQIGNPNAPIKLIEYGALSCSHCAEFSEKGAAQLRDEFVNSGRVQFELRLFMLNALDVPAALLATCGSQEAVIARSDQFWSWQKQMFTNLQQAGEAQFQAAGSLPPEQRFATLAKLGGMDAFFAGRGVAADQAKVCLADTKKATALVEATDKAGKEMGVTGTPTFFLNGKKLEGNTWEVVKADLERAGAR
jgi:protein-disulfide isomerase